MAVVVAASAVTLAAGEQRYRVIVNSSRAVQQLSNDQLADYFLKRAKKWPDGVAVTPVDLTMKSEVRRSFTEDVLANTVNEMLAYWERQIAAGRKTPPAVKGSDEGVVAFVKANPGAIGYVSTEASMPPGVREIAILHIDTRAVRAAE